MKLNNMTNDNINIETARTSMGMSRLKLSKWLDIPYRTLCSWEKGERECPKYVERLVVEKILRDGKSQEQEDEDEA